MLLHAVRVAKVARVMKCCLAVSNKKRTSSWIRSLAHLVRTEVRTLSKSSPKVVFTSQQYLCSKVIRAFLIADLGTVLIHTHSLGQKTINTSLPRIE